MSENNSTIQIDIPVPEIATPETPPPAAPVTVVETGGNDAAAAPLADATIDHEGRLVRIETTQELILATLAEINQRAADAEFGVSMVAESVQEVQQEIAEIEAGEQDDAADDEEPAREHPFYRSRKIFGKAG